MKISLIKPVNREEQTLAVYWLIPDDFEQSRASAF